jgi:uncharacterized repeat protein (TIGR03803 family)
LVQATDGDLYGTTTYGGANGFGTVFKITPTGTLTTLHSFDNTDGAEPWAALVQGSDGNFYGTTETGGPGGWGTIFQITPAGTLTTLHDFQGTDGFSPVGGLVQHTDGNFYGAASSGGAHNHGTAYKLSLGLAPFVRTVPAFAKVGASVAVLGTDLTSPISVTFNGTPAAIAAVSPSAVIATVPAGATTGMVQVTTPSGTLSSNTAFQVLP